MPNIGAPEIIIVLIIALVVFGPKRLPDLGRSLGSGMREFKNSITGKDDEEEKLDATKRELTEPQAPTAESVDADVVTDARS